MHESKLLVPEKPEYSLLKSTVEGENKINEVQEESSSQSDSDEPSSIAESTTADSNAKIIGTRNRVTAGKVQLTGQEVLTITWRENHLPATANILEVSGLVPLET